MSYYVTVRDGERVGWLAGPFKRHGDALRMVAPAKKLAQELNSRGIWYAYGTTHVKTAPLTTKIGPGILNEHLAL